MIKHTKSEQTQIGLFPNPTLKNEVEMERLNRYLDILKFGGTPYDLEEDMQVKRWEKVVWNAAWNSVTSLTLLDTHTWLNLEGGMSLTRQLMTEVIEVARKCNADLSYDLIDVLIKRILEMPPIYSSMHADRVAGRQMEVDIILGTSVRKARQFGMKVPTLETLYTTLAGLNLYLSKSKTSY